MGRIVSAVLITVCAVVLVAGTGTIAQENGDKRKFVPVTDAMLQKPAPADWLMWRRTADSWGYSPLNQINTSNVSRLRMVWTRGLEPGIQEGTPLVHDGVMYFPNPFDVIQALDARTGDLKWEYRRKLPENLDKVFRVPMITRNLAIYGNLIIDTGADDSVYSLDAETGKPVWETKIFEWTDRPAQQTSGPIIANGKVVSGRGCEPEGGPDACVITAHDAKTGLEVWRRRTIPRPGEPGDATWGNVPEADRRHVGTWMVPSYDPQLNLIYVGTSVTSPAPKFLFDGNDKEYLYHNSTLALNADTGAIVWYYQHLVDHWDLDHPFERLIVDTAVAPDPTAVPWINPKVRKGERRRVITGIPGKTGVVYTLDAKTGEFLWARPTVMQNVVKSIDGTTGKVTVNPETIYSKMGDKRLVCPNTNGGKNWQAGAYSPLTNAMYMPLQNTCKDETAVVASREEAWKARSLYGVRATNSIAPGTTNVGTIYAVSVETGATLWKYEQRAATTSLVATGGGLVFSGDISGRFRAHDQKSGEVVWEVNLGSAVTGYPIAFEVDGREYIAVSTGRALATGGANVLTPEIRPSAASNLFVFALPN